MREFKDPGKNEERTYNTRPPIPDEFLVRVYKRWRMNHESKHIPKDYLEAARWWLAHQESCSHNETPVVGYDSKGNQHWTTPYIERVVASWRKFLSLSEVEKAFVIDRIGNGIPYRGDDIEFYKEVCRQQEIMDKDPEAYKRSARGAISGFDMSQPTE
jgi:hypothetical protein